MKILRVLGMGLALLVLVGWGAGRYLLGREAVPEATTYRIDRTRLQTLATAGAEALPVAVRHQVVAEVSLPRAAVFAGEPFTPHTMLHGVYQVLYPDGGFVLIDAAMGPEVLAAMSSDGKFDEVAFARVQRALRTARAVVVTHEHADHIDGLGQGDDLVAVAERLILNAAQYENPETHEILPLTLLEAVEPIAGAGLRRIAPGIVLVPAPGHTPGSQLVYVKLQDGREHLFVGDVAWHMDALRELHYRPRLVTDFFLGEDRAAVMAQFRTLHALLDDPTLEIVVSHDAEQRHALVRSGALGDGLELEHAKNPVTGPPRPLDPRHLRSPLGGGG